MTTYNAKKWVLKSYPKGVPKVEDFSQLDTTVDASKLEQGQLVVEVKYISVDPYQRNLMREEPMKDYPFPPFKVGEPISGFAIAKVLKSNDEQYKEGDIVTSGGIQWQTIQIIDSKAVSKYHFSDISLSYGVGVLGMTGATAYLSLLKVIEPKEGDRILISGASGAVGSIVGQIAKLKGCKVVGIAGSDEKVEILKEEYGFDDGINYKKVSNIREAIKEKYPEGFDIYFDNVGGETFDAAVQLINKKGKILICGTISSYNNEGEEEKGIHIASHILLKDIRIRAFLIVDWVPEWGTAFGDLSKWIKEGKIKPKETVTKGFENTPLAFVNMLTGKNIGKQVVEV